MDHDRGEDRTDDVVLDDLERLGAQLRREVDEIVDVQTEPREGRRSGREGLGLRQLLTRHRRVVVDRPFDDRPHRLTGHPIEDYLVEIQQFCPCNIAALKAGKRSQTVAGLVVSARTMRSRRGDSIGFVEVDDRSGRIEAALFSDVYRAEKEKIAKDAVLVLEGEIAPDDYSGSLKMRAERVHTMEEARRRFAVGVVTDCGGRTVPAQFAARLRSCLEPHRSVDGGCTVAVIYQTANRVGVDARGRIILGSEWSVSPSDELLRDLRTEFGNDRVAMDYVVDGA